jgi:hypothetical protein
MNTIVSLRIDKRHNLKLFLLFLGFLLFQSLNSSPHSSKSRLGILGIIYSKRKVVKRDEELKGKLAGVLDLIKKKTKQTQQSIF